MMILIILNSLLKAGNESNHNNKELCLTWPILDVKTSLKKGKLHLEFKLSQYYFWQSTADGDLGPS